MDRETIFHLLGIEATTDEKKIKKAYANQVKNHHPEEDQEGFKQLQQAYHEAIKYAKNCLWETKEQMKMHPENEVEEELAEESIEIDDDELLEIITRSILAKNEGGVMDALSGVDAKRWDKDSEFLDKITSLLLAQNINLSYSMRKIFIDHFHLWEKEDLSLPQQRLLQAVEKGIVNFEEVVLSCVKDIDYLLNCWHMLLCKRGENVEEWMNFLDEKNWTKDEVEAENIEKLLSMELTRNTSHNSVVAGRIYSFLRIGEHLEDDPKQIYARFQNLLEKDAPFSKLSLEKWKCKYYIDAQFLVNRASLTKESPAEWKKCLEEQNLDIEDFELQARLAKGFEECYFSRAVKKVLISFFNLEQPDSYLKKKLKDAILSTPKEIVQNRMKFSGIVIVLFFVLCMVMYYEKQEEKQIQQNVEFPQSDYKEWLEDSIDSLK